MVLTVLVLGLLACTTTPPADPLPAPIPVPVAPTEPGDIDPTMLVTEVPLATDESGFIEQEVHPDGAVLPIVDGITGKLQANNYPIATPRTIRGVNCSAPSLVMVGADGKWGCNLAKDWLSNGLTVPAGTAAWFWLATEHAQNLPLPDPGPTLIGGVACKSYASFDANGHLAECVLAKDRLFQGDLEVPVGSVLSFDAAGLLVGAQLRSPATIDGITYEDHWDLSFDTNGEVTGSSKGFAE